MKYLLVTYEMHQDLENPVGWVNMVCEYEEAKDLNSAIAIGEKIETAILSNMIRNGYAGLKFKILNTQTL